MNAIAQASAAPVSGSKLDNRRVMAAIVDLLIVVAGAVVILVAGDSLSGDRPGALAAVIIGWALYYFFALESGEGQTLGKRLMKIRVVRADGRPAGMGEIAVRTILRVIDNYLVGMIVMIATGERRQRIGDLAAGTIVVDASGPAVMAPPAPMPPRVSDVAALSTKGLPSSLRRSSSKNAAARASECCFIRSPSPRPRKARITPVPAFIARPVSRSE